MRFRKRLKLVLLEKVEDALAQQRSDQADMVAEVKVLEQLDAFAIEERRQRDGQVLNMRAAILTRYRSRPDLEAS